MKNFNMVKLNLSKAKSFLKEELMLTGCEVSFGVLGADEKVPFLHAHKQNEEVYIFLKGEGTFSVDGEEFAVSKDSVVRVATAGMRGLSAKSTGLEYICIQAKENSLIQETMQDGIIG